MRPVWQNAYCAFCRSPRRIYTKRHVSWADIFYTLALGVLLSLFFWQTINPRVIPFSVTLLGVMEIFIQIRWRMSLPCSKCGFDPLTYLRSPEKAAARVKEKFTERMENPNILDKRLPILDVLRAAKQEKDSRKSDEPRQLGSKSNRQSGSNKI